MEAYKIKIGKIIAKNWFHEFPQSRNEIKSIQKAFFNRISNHFILLKTLKILQC